MQPLTLNPTTRDTFHWLLAGILPALAMAIVALATWEGTHTSHGDLSLYYRFSTQVLAGQWPYLDFPSEYPPLAGISFLLPRILLPVSTAEDYRSAFLLCNTFYVFVIGLAASCIARQSGQRLTPMILMLSLFAGITAPAIAWRFDLFPAMLTALALAFVLHQRPLCAGCFLGLGIAAKLYPIVLVPVLLLGHFTRREWKNIARFGFGLGAVLLVSFLPIWLAAPEGLAAFFRYHAARGTHVESVTGGVFAFFHALDLAPLKLELNYGAWHLASPTLSTLLPLQTFAFPLFYALLLGAIYLQLAKHSKSAPTMESRLLVRHLTLALLLFVTMNKVFSPQYLAWLLPFIPLLGYSIGSLFTLTCLTTVAVFPYLYGPLLSFELTALVLLNLRNLSLVALIPCLLVQRKSE